VAEKARLGATPEGVAGASSLASSAGLRPLNTSLLQKGLDSVAKKLDDAIITEAVIGAKAQAKSDLDEFGVGGAPLRRVGAFNRRTAQAYNEELIRTTVEKVDQQAINKANFLMNHDEYRLDPEGARAAWDAYAEANVSEFRNDPMFGRRFAAAQAERLEAIGDKAVSQIEVNRVQRNLELVQAARSEINQIHFEGRYDAMKQRGAQAQTTKDVRDFLNVELKDEVVAIGEYLREQNTDEIYNPNYVENLRMRAHDEMVKQMFDGLLVAARSKPHLVGQIIHELDKGTEYFINKNAQADLLKALKDNDEVFQETRTNEMRTGTKQIVQVVNGAPVGRNNVTVNSIDMSPWQVQLQTTPDGSRAKVTDLGHWNKYAKQKYPENKDKRTRLLNSAMVNELAYYYAANGNAEALGELAESLEGRRLQKDTGDLNGVTMKKRILRTKEKIENARGSKNKIDILSYINEVGTVEGYMPILQARGISGPPPNDPDAGLFKNFSLEYAHFVSDQPENVQKEILGKAWLIHKQMSVKTDQAKKSLALQGVESHAADTGIFMTAEAKAILRGASGKTGIQVAGLIQPLIIAGQAEGWDPVAVAHELTSEVPKDEVPSTYGEAVLITAIGASNTDPKGELSKKISSLAQVDHVTKLKALDKQQKTDFESIVDMIPNKQSFRNVESALSPEGAYGVSIRNTFQNLFRGWAALRVSQGRGFDTSEFITEVIEPIEQAMGATKLTNKQQIFVPPSTPNRDNVTNALNYIVSDLRAGELLQISQPVQATLKPQVSVRDGTVEIQLKRTSPIGNSLEAVQSARGINEAEASKALTAAMEGFFSFDDPNFQVTIAKSDGGLIVRIDSSKKDRNIRVEKGGMVDSLIDALLPKPYNLDAPKNVPKLLQRPL
jgi:hypothetical protein